MIAYPLSMQQDDTQRAQEAFDALRAAYDLTVKVVLGLSDLDQALAYTADLRDLAYTEFTAAAMQARSKVLASIAREEDESPSRLGARIGVSKQRGEQLIKKMRKDGDLPPKDA